MKTLLTLVCILTVSLASGQVVKNKADQGKQKAGQKANQRVDRKIDQGIDKGLDAVEGLFRRKKKTENSDTNNSESAANPAEAQAQQNAMLSLLGNSKTVELPASYSFTHQMDVLMTYTSKRGKQDQNAVTFHIQPNGQQLGISVQLEEDGKTSSAITVFDMEAQQMVVFTTANQQNMAMAIPLDDQAIETYRTDKPEDEAVSFTKTGNTKQILGYTCQEYRYESNENSGTTWVTDELPQYRHNFTALAAQAQKKEQSMPANYPTGTLMETLMKSHNGETSHWLVTAIRSNDLYSIETSQYQIMAMPGSGRGRGN